MYWKVSPFDCPLNMQSKYLSWRDMTIGLFWKEDIKNHQETLSKWTRDDYLEGETTYLKRTKLSIQQK